MAEIDVLLSASLKRSAQPGDAAGVADAIRSRVAAGDTGTPAASSGFGDGGLLSWLPWVALVVIAGVVGGAAGASGVFAPEPAAVTLPNLPAVVSMAPTFSCPGGEVVGSVVAGSRVLAIQRSADDSFLAVRDPWNRSSTVWVSRADVAIDAGQDTASIPVGGCPVITFSAPVVVPPPVEVPSDTVAPSIIKAWASPTVILNDEETLVHATASDDVGVTSVSVRLSGAASGTGSMTRVGDEWQFLFSSSSTDSASYGVITFALTSHDAAGNSSSPVSVTVDRQYFG